MLIFCLFNEYIVYILCIIQVCTATGLEMLYIFLILVLDVFSYVMALQHNGLTLSFHKP